MANPSRAERRKPLQEAYKLAHPEPDINEASRRAEVSAPLVSPAVEPSGDNSKEESDSTAGGWRKVRSWSVISAIIVLMFSAWVSFMTAGRAVIGDVSFLAGVCLLVWRLYIDVDVGLRKIRGCLFVGLLVVTVGCVLGNHYVNAAWPWTKAIATAVQTTPTRDSPLLTEEQTAQIARAVRKALPRSLLIPPPIKSAQRDPAAFGDASCSELLVLCGTNTFHLPMLAFKGKPVEPMRLQGNLPFSFYWNEGGFFVNASLFGGVGEPKIEVIMNKIKVNDGSWDSNYTDKAMEVVTRDGTPVLQIIRSGASRIELNAIVPTAGPVYLLTPSGLRSVAPNDYESIRSALKPLFKYPSWRFKGVFAD